LEVMKEESEPKTFCSTHFSPTFNKEREVESERNFSEEKMSFSTV